MKVKLRPMEWSDREIILEWRNSAFIIERSSSLKPVTAEEHSRWFGQVTSHPDILPYIIEVDEVPVGQVRLDLNRDENYCVITIYLIESFTGKGLGIMAIKQGCIFAWKKWSNVNIVAHVRGDNVVGQSAFRKAGFKESKQFELVDHISFLLDGSKEECKTSFWYSSLYESHGFSHKTLNWGSKESQILRFQVLSEIDDLRGKSILDVGCGLGDFARWLKKENIHVSYTGIDITPKLVEQARKNHPTYQFIQGSILDNLLLEKLINHNFDYVFASGIFYTYTQGSYSWMQSAISRMWSLCTKGLAFNSLSAWAKDLDPTEFYAEPLKTIEYCRQLSPDIVFRHDYHPRDFTIYMLKKG
jgi:SAM-dependent methyltransferase